MGRVCSTHGKKINAYRISVGKARMKVRSRCRWEDNIKMDLRETGWKGLD
jgi:hypothetical protein